MDNITPEKAFGAPMTGVVHALCVATDKDRLKMTHSGSKTSVRIDLMFIATTLV
jgi:hypothetical protein